MNIRDVLRKIGSHTTNDAHIALFDTLEGRMNSMPTEEEMRKHRCCFTGHRPQKLKRPEWLVKLALEREIKLAIKEGFTVYISGMAQGVDIWAAEIVLRLRSKGQPIRLICASPFEGFENRWSKEWQRRYRDIIDAADYVTFVSPKYSPSCFQIRNEWMVRHASRVIAVFNGEPSGTKNTIDYAERQNVPVRIIEG